MAKNNKPKEHIIVTSIYDIDDYKERFNEYCDMNSVDPDNENIHEFIQQEIAYWFEDERSNLNVECNGDIIAIADLGLWNGRFSGYNIIHATKLSDIFNVGMSDIEDYKFYCDRYNVKAELYHHDGTNYIEYRLLKKGVNPKPLLDRLYNQENVSRETIRKYTTSLRPMVAKVYGW